MPPVPQQPGLTGCTSPTMWAHKACSWRREQSPLPPNNLASRGVQTPPCGPIGPARSRVLGLTTRLLAGTRPSLKFILWGRGLWAYPSCVFRHDGSSPC
ncbi:hypothetical protein AMTR_s00055p00118060 [Amborella trichopoda]|uniref:Uncharacterized protein n=1 Tax=Amborella trichopoda TaxID=13333 RepID=U5DCW9_AMBTC|nr:hypothetical protein AMTR_s00055p00118060 [Amborella trichopoda]